ncbi:unnamed protein product [Brassica napus]|nr:PREDICTED: uncharacterized protein LOC106325743 [Brassica oleracea var. oleracea]CAF2077146.1 unnamed protein product [Brassica napus]
MSSSSSSSGSVSELIKLLYSAHLSSRESERTLIIQAGEAFSGEGSSDELFSEQHLLHLCFPTGQSKSEEVIIAQSTAKSYLQDSTKKLRMTETTYSSIKASINRILSPDFQYIDFTHPFDCKRRKTIAIWDFENCPVTTLTHHKTVIPNIEKGLKNLGFVGALQIVGVGNRGFLRGDAYLDSLSSVELFHEVKIGNEEDTSDKRLIVEMRTRMEQHLEKYNEPGNILLMTGDIDFLGVIREAKRLGFYVLLAYNEKKNVRSELK